MRKTKRRKNTGFNGNHIIIPRYFLWGGVKNCKIISSCKISNEKKVWNASSEEASTFCLKHYFNFSWVTDIHPPNSHKQRIGSDSYSDGLFPLLSTISRRIFSFNNILLKISPSYREDAPKICTLLLSGVWIFLPNKLWPRTIFQMVALFLKFLFFL